MLFALRKIRNTMLKQNKVSSYLLYAIGEIVLVVVGILIAVQIDNWNENSKERNLELHYLKNIKGDLAANIKIIDQFLISRDSCINSAKIIISHLEGEPVMNWKTFNEHCINIYDWRRYYRVNTTFEELTYSGNLGLITNDSIKTQLLNLESMFVQTKGEEDHFRFDSEEIIYKPLYNLVDLHPSLRKFGGENIELNYAMYKDYFADIRVKNGFLMVILEFSKMNEQLSEMKKVSQQLIKTIDRELSKVKI